MNKPLTYLIAENTFFDADKELFYTDIAVEGKNMPLHYTVWANTETESRKKAIRLAEILTNN